MSGYYVVVVVAAGIVGIACLSRILGEQA